MTVNVSATRRQRVIEMDDADIGPADCIGNSRRQTGHLVAAGKDVAGIYAAAECLGTINAHYVLYKGTEIAQITCNFGTLTGAGFQQEPAARHPAPLCGIQDRAEETTHTTESLLFAEFQGLSDVDDDASRSNSSTCLEEIDDERNQALPATMVSARRIIPRAWIDDIGRMDEETYIEFSDRQFNRIARGGGPRGVRERFWRCRKYLGSRKARKFTMEGMKKGGKADAVATDTGAAVIADRRKRHERTGTAIP